MNKKQQLIKQLAEILGWTAEETAQELETIKQIATKNNDFEILSIIYDIEESEGGEDE